MHNVQCMFIFMLFMLDWLIFFKINNKQSQLPIKWFVFMYAKVINPKSDVCMPFHSPFLTACV